MKHMKYLSILSLICLISLAQPDKTIAQQSGIVTLKSCQEDAITNYPAARDKELLKQVSALKIQNLQTNYLPQITLNGQTTYQSEAIKINSPVISIDQSRAQYKATLDVNELIYDGGFTRYMKRLEVTSSDADVQQVEVDLFKIREQVNNVYFLLISLQENEKLIAATLNEVAEKENIVTSSVKNGVLIPSDLDVLMAEKLKIEQQLSEITINRKAALAILNILTNKSMTDSTVFELPHPEIVEAVAVNRPEYQLFDIQSKRLDDSRNLTGSMLMPKLYAFAQGGYGRPGLNFLKDKFAPFYIVGASLKWTIFDWNKNSRDKAVIDFQKQMIVTRKESFDRNLNTDLQNKLASIQKLQESIQRDKEILSLRHRITLSATSRLDNGIITSTDFLTELNAETIAKINAQTHLIQLEQAKVNYLLAKGHFE